MVYKNKSSSKAPPKAAKERMVSSTIHVWKVLSMLRPKYSFIIYMREHQ